MRKYIAIWLIGLSGVFFEISYRADQRWKGVELWAEHAPEDEPYPRGLRRQARIILTTCRIADRLDRLALKFDPTV